MAVFGERAGIGLRRLGRVLLMLLLLPAVGWAQKPPLAEVARKEQERRKTVKASEKVLTNEDLPPNALRPPSPATPAPTAEIPIPADKPEEEKEQKRDERDEAWWRARITEARAAVQRNELFLQALQSRVNALSMEFVARDDPYQRARIGEDRQKALAEMERVTAEIALGRQQIEDIEEEARKAGVPPGWLR